MTSPPDITETWARRVLWTLTVLAIAYTTFFIAMTYPSARRERPLTWRRLKNCVLAVDNYAYQNGTTPSDARGPEYALYALNEANHQLPAEMFSTEYDPTPATWDADEGKLVSGDIAYANVATSDRRVVILVAPASGESSVHYLATLDLFIIGVSAKDVADPLAFLGTYYLFDFDLYLAAEAYEQLHSLPEGEFLHCARSGDRITTAFYDWGTVAYQYNSDGRLCGRQILPTNGASRTQRITTDGNGIVVEIDEVDSEVLPPEEIPEPAT